MNEYLCMNKDFVLHFAKILVIIFPLKFCLKFDYPWRNIKSSHAHFDFCSGHFLQQQTVHSYIRSKGESKMFVLFLTVFQSHIVLQNIVQTPNVPTQDAFTLIYKEGGGKNDFSIWLYDHILTLHLQKQRN